MLPNAPALPYQCRLDGVLIITSLVIGGYEETQVLSDSLISSERGVLLKSLGQFAAGELGLDDWGWSMDLANALFVLFDSAWERCKLTFKNTGAGYSLDVLVSISRQAGALLALRRLPKDLQKWGGRRARAAGILQVRCCIRWNRQGLMQSCLYVYMRESISDSLSHM